MNKFSHSAITSTNLPLENFVLDKIISIVDLRNLPTIFILPSNEIMLNTEFAVPTTFKILPLIFTISLSIISLLISEFNLKTLILFKLFTIGYILFSFFNQRFYIDLFFNNYINFYNKIYNNLLNYLV